MHRVPCVVVGGGITGLAAGLDLRRALGADAVVLLESSDRLGGKIRTEHHDGLLIEGGPDSFLASKPGGVELCRTLGLEDRLVAFRPGARRAFVKRRGRLHPLPEGITGLVPSRIAPLLASRTLSLRGRLRAGFEPLVRRRRDESDESIGAFVRRRFGHEAYEHLIEPLLSGIYAGDGDALSLQSTFPQLRRMEREHGSVMRSLVATPRPERHGAGFVTLPGGLVELVDAARAALEGVVICTNAPVHHIERAGSGYRVVLASGEVVAARSVVLATPAAAAATIVSSLDGTLAAPLARIPHVSTAIVTLAFRNEDAAPLPETYGYVSPRAEGGRVVACSISSRKFEGRAPDHRVLFRCFLGRAGSEGIMNDPDEVLVREASDELHQVLGIAGAPVVAHVTRWPDGLPQYTTGHATRMAEIAERLRASPGLQLAGASFDGVGIPDCIASGQKAAAALTTYLNNP